MLTEKVQKCFDKNLLNSITFLGSNVYIMQMKILMLWLLVNEHFHK